MFDLKPGETIILYRYEDPQEIQLADRSSQIAVDEKKTVRDELQDANSALYAIHSPENYLNPYSSSESEKFSPSIDESNDNDLRSDEFVTPLINKQIVRDVHVETAKKSRKKSFSRRFGRKVTRGIGAGLVGFSIIALIFTFAPIVRQEIIYRLRPKTEAPVTKFWELLDYTEAQRISKVQEEAKKYDLDAHFSVAIPKIEAYAQVVANVDPGVEKEYTEALKQGVAHARGTYFPGQGKKVYLFAHSTDTPGNVARYNAVFYLLGKMEPGDAIIVFFADKKYTYVVKEKKVVGPDEVEWLKTTTDSEELILQTCTPPGTTYQRLLVIATPQ